MKFSSGDVPRIPPEFQGSGIQPCWHVKLQYRRLLVTSFLSDKGSSSLKSMSQLEWNVSWNLESLIFPGTHLLWLLISSYQSINKSALEEEEREAERPNWEPEMELQVLSSNQSKKYIYICGKIISC